MPASIRVRQVCPRFRHTPTHPHPTARTNITVDASDNAVGGQLEQFQAGIWLPIAFFSRKLSNAEKKYSSLDRELLAIYLAVKHFRHFVEGRAFTIYTDHKPLTFTFASSTERSPRQTRHLSFIAEFSTDVRYITSKKTSLLTSCLVLTFLEFSY